MNNNVLSNGRMPNAPGTQRSRITDRSKKVPDIPAIASHNWLLHKHYTRHEYEKCKTLIENELQKSNGYNEYAHYLKGLISRKEGRIQDSLDSFQNAYNVNSTNINNVKQIAKSLFIIGSHKRALEAYLEAEKMLTAPDWDIYQSIGECYVSLSQRDEAKTYLKKAIEFTKNEVPYLTLAKIYDEDNEVDQAKNVYEAALKGNPENVELATELGLLYLKMGDTQRAFQQFAAALTNSPICAKALLPMASIMQDNQEYDVALSKYKIAAHSLPESASLWNNVGMCFYGKQKFVAAISCLKRAHYLNPLALLPTYNLGIVFLTTGQPASAAVHLSCAISIDPTNAMSYLLLGVALHRLNDVEGAEEALTKAHSCAPQDPLILINFAVILHVRGNVERAAELLQTLNDIVSIIDVDPQIEQAAKKLSRQLRTDEETDRRFADDEV